FFQAEDGIRDRTVTGVQTCALPISTLEASRTDVLAADAAIKTAAADLVRAQADEEKAKLDYGRAQGLFKAELIAKSEYDMRKNEIGRASCRERVEIWEGDGCGKKET